ncbi:unnamed protein product, partial [marine sediment metagenome]
MYIGQSIRVIGSFFRITYLRNPNVAFGIPVGSPLLMMVLTSIATILLIVYFFRIKEEGILFNIGLVLIIGGAIGNLIDRFRMRQVIDFIEIGIKRFKWPVFNIADSFESKIIEGFGEIVKNGYIYKGKRPIHWCPVCKTALAEAEVEYAEHTSPSIYIKFPIIDFGEDFDTSFIIWTTTPWTLPANVAVAVHPRETYLLFKWRGNGYIVAEPLFDLCSRGATPDVHLSWRRSRQ